MCTLQVDFKSNGFVGFLCRIKQLNEYVDHLEKKQNGEKTNSKLFYLVLCTWPMMLVIEQSSVLLLGIKLYLLGFQTVFPI